jgi:phosphohistidine phosphatase SixA
LPLHSTIAKAQRPKPFFSFATANQAGKDSDLDDHERRSTRGKKDARGWANCSRTAAAGFDRASSAKRCRKTADHVIHTSGYRGRRESPANSMSPDAAKLPVVTALTTRRPRAADRHNPGMEVFLESLSASIAAHVQLSPASSCRLTTGATSPPTRGQLVQLWQPRELGNYVG